MSCLREFASGPYTKASFDTPMFWLGKNSCNEVIEACEAFDNFDRHYLNNLSLLSADIQTPEDVERVKSMLGNLKVAGELRHLSWFLFRKRDTSDHLNVQILLDHLNELEDASLEEHVKAMFSHPEDYISSDWRDGVSRLLTSLVELGDDQQVGISSPALAVALYFAPFARWVEREATMNLFSNRATVQEFHVAINLCKLANSDAVQACVAEIEGEQATI